MQLAIDEEVIVRIFGVLFEHRLPVGDINLICELRGDDDVFGWEFREREERLQAAGFDDRFARFHEFGSLVVPIFQR